MATFVLPGTKIDYTVTLSEDEAEYTVVVSALFTDGIEVRPGSASYTRDVNTLTAAIDVDGLVASAKTASGL